MREILFRGKRKSSRKKYQTWVYGSLFLEKGYCNIQFYTEGMMSIDDADVIQKTVGQYTGLTDKNGNKIFEGDILKFTDDEGGSLLYVVKWADDYAGWVTQMVNTDCVAETMDCWDNWGIHYEIVGNIHDNPELLKVTSNEK